MFVFTAKIEKNYINLQKYQTSLSDSLPFRVRNIILTFLATTNLFFENTSNSGQHGADHQTGTDIRPNAVGSPTSPGEPAPASANARAHSPGNERLSRKPARQLRSKLSGSNCICGL